MTSFDFLWKLLDSHGVVESKKCECAQLWDTFSAEQQQQIYNKISNKIRAGKYVDYNPYKAVRDNAPRQQTLTLSFAEYYAKYGTTEPQDGWRMENPTGEQVIFVKT